MTGQPVFFAKKEPFGSHIDLYQMLSLLQSFYTSLKDIGQCAAFFFSQSVCFCFDAAWYPCGHLSFAFFDATKHLFVLIGVKVFLTPFLCFCQCEGHCGLAGIDHDALKRGIEKLMK